MKNTIKTITKREIKEDSTNRLIVEIKTIRTPNITKRFFCLEVTEISTNLLIGA